MKGRKKRNAMKYLNPAKETGLILFNPVFMIINDEDHNTVTNRAMKILLTFRFIAEILIVNRRQKLKK